MNVPARPKKIVIIPSWYPSPRAPVVGIFFQEQAQCLSRRFDVTVLTPRFPSLSELLSLRWGPTIVQHQDASLSTLHVRKIKVPTLRRYLPFFSGPNHRLVYYRKFLSAIRSGFEHYRKRSGLPDVIHAHVVLPAGWAAVELGREFGVPVVITEHNGPFSFHLASQKQRQLVREILGAADRVVAVSASLRADMHAFCPEVPIDIIGNLIDTDFFLPRSQPRERSNLRRFFFLGALLVEKGVQFLLQAARTLLDQGMNDFEVVIGGEGSYRPALERLAEELEVRTHCRFVGLLNRARARAEMQACDVFVLPSLGETFGIVVGEAMACGKPVLATRCGGPEDQVTPETGMLVKPGDPGELAAGMASFLTRRIDFPPERIRAHVARYFGPDAFLDKNQALYERLEQNRVVCCRLRKPRELSADPQALGVSR